MKVKEENKTLFIQAMQKLVWAIKNEIEDCGELCGGLNEKEINIIDFIGQRQQVKMSDIAENIAAPMSTLTNIADKLVDKKYLSREHGGDDRRVIYVTLAENGKTAFRAIKAKKQLVAGNILSQYNEKEQATFIEHMNILAAELGLKK
jgi:DNA-binding MarR family transcriptional regulator